MDRSDWDRLRSAGSELTPRHWALARIEEWLADGTGPPLLLVRGDPGSGKSSLLLQLIAAVTDPGSELGLGGDRILSTILRDGRHTDDEYDASALLLDIVKGLDRSDAATGLDPALDRLVPLERNPLNVQVEQNVTSAQIVAGVVINLTSPETLVEHAVRAIRATVASDRSLVIVDALDQAEDERAQGFLQAIARICHAAAGRGLRVLCTSRRRLPIEIDPALSRSFDLTDDAPDRDGDLQTYLADRLANYDAEERERLTTSILRGAHGNWLWAATNAAALERDAEIGPDQAERAPLSEGLDGLYGDGVRRLQLLVGQEQWRTTVIPMLSAVACAFGGRLPFAEMRWVVKQEEAYLRDLVSSCEPFLDVTDDGQVRVFHPDFGRWLLGGNVAALSEPAAHLALARGLTELGEHTDWGPVTWPYAASRVVDHWCAAIILDPFHPNAEEHERKLWQLITSPGWAEHADLTFRTIEQVGFVAPAFRFPGSNLPLVAGIRAFFGSPAAEAIVGARLSTLLSDPEVAEFEALLDLPYARALEWLKDHIPDIDPLVFTTLWGETIRGHFELVTRDGRARVHATPALGVDGVRSGAFDTETGRLAVKGVVDLLTAVDTDRWIDALTAVDRLGPVAHANGQWLLGVLHERRAELQPSDDARTPDLQQAIGFFETAFENTPAPHPGRLDAAASLSDLLRTLSDGSPETLDRIVVVQREIVDLRRAADDPRWPSSVNLLGDALRDRARVVEDADDRQTGLEAALAAYQEALDATPADHERRVGYAIDTANTLIELPTRTPAQLDRLIALQREIVDRRRAAGDPGWPGSSNLLGDALRERVGGADDPEAQQEGLETALDAYQGALDATPTGHERRPTYLIDTANTLLALPTRTPAQLDRLIALQREIVDLWRAADDPGWAASSKVLGDALRAKADLARDAEGRRAGLEAALAAYQDALDAAPTGHEHRLTFVIDAASTLLALPTRTAEQLDRLIALEREIVDLRRAAEDPAWVPSANLLGDALRERAELTGDAGDRQAELEAALVAYQDALEATPPDDQSRVTYAIDTASALIALPSPTPEQLDRLVSVLGEAIQLLSATDDPRLPISLMALGDALRGVAERDAGDAGGSDSDSGEVHADDRASAAYRSALDEAERLAAGTPEGDSSRPDRLVMLADVLQSLPDRSAEVVDRWVVVQREIVDLRRAANDPGWSASLNLLGDALRDQARAVEDPEEGQAGLEAALAAYQEALDATPPDDERRLVFAIDTANTLLALATRTAEQRDRLIALQQEIVELRRAAGDAGWPASLNLLGDALREKVDPTADPEDRHAALEAALAAYQEALDATPPDHERRLTYAIDTANALSVLPTRTAEQVDQRVALQQEIVELRRAAGDPRWPISTNLLGDALRERAERNTVAQMDWTGLEAALAAYQEALDATPPGDERRLTFAVDTANALMALPTRTVEQLNRLIVLQQEIVDLRRAVDDPEWPLSSNLLGDALRERADLSEDPEHRQAGLEAALAAYQLALDALPADDDRRLTFAVDTANALVIRAALTRTDGPQALARAAELVASAIDLHAGDFGPLSGLVPIVASAVRRAGHWPG